MYLPDKAGRRRATAVFLLPSLVGIIGFCLLPIAGSLFFSLMDYDLLRPMDSMTFVGLKTLCAFSRDGSSAACWRTPSPIWACTCR